ncbi:hypothetical protein D918_02152 [Trichuris suis]|nr:hypothetical protein D918_02152 [Trichuris suis]
MLSRASTLSRPLVTAVFIPSVGKCSSVTDGSGSSTNNDEQNQSADICLDISRMSSWHRSIYHGECPTMNKFRWQSERRNLRKRFAMYGKASDVDLSVLWPNNTELEILQYEEDNWKPKLENMIKLEKTLAMKADARMQRRIEQVETNVKNYNKVLKEYNEKREKREREMLAAKQENERKIREIQVMEG